MKKQRSKSKFLTQNPTKKLVIQINVKPNKKQGQRKSCLYQKNAELAKEKKEDSPKSKLPLNDAKDKLLNENLKTFNQSLEGEANIIKKIIVEKFEEKNESTEIFLSRRYSGDLKSGLVWILNVWKEVGFQRVWILNGI